VDDYVQGAVADWDREYPDLDTSPMDVAARIVRAGEFIQRRLNSVAAAHGVSHKGDVDVLTALRRSGHPYELTPTQLAQRLLLTSGGMTNRLDRLEAGELIERRPDPSDRRGVLVGLTSTGAALAEAAFRDGLEAQAAVLAAIDESDGAVTARTLKKLLVSMGDTEVGPSGPTPQD
jgi:DNA-binding MarR family transcriptional regulator